METRGAQYTGNHPKMGEEGSIQLTQKASLNDTYKERYAYQPKMHSGISPSAA